MSTESNTPKTRKQRLLRRAAKEQYRLEGKFVSRDRVLEVLQEQGFPLTRLYAVTPETWNADQPPPFRRRKNPNRVRAAKEREARRRASKTN